jgi:Mrp family chromosome partitioning ATPase
MSSQDPRLAAAIPNALAAAYIDMQGDAARQSGSDVAALLEPEIAELTKRVEEAEARVVRFRNQWGLFLKRDDSGLAAEQLSELSSELTRTRAARAAAEAGEERVRASLEGEGILVSLPGVPSSPVFESLRETRAELQTQLSALSATLLDDHPRVRALKLRLDDLEARIRAEAENVAQGLRAEAATVHARERQIAADLDRLKAEAAQASEKEVELRALERDAAVQHERLTSHLARYSEATARRVGNFMPAGVRIVTRATVPSDPYFPRMLPIAAAAFAASVVVMALWSLLRRSLSRSATQSAAAARMEPIEEVTVPAHGDGAATGVRPERLPVSSMILAPIGQEELQAASGLGEIDIHRAADMIVASGAVRALFISPEGDDAAAAAVLVAREIADAGLRVLLLDLTTAGAASRPMLDTVSYPGITNLLAAEAQFTDVIHQDHYSNCHVIPVGTADPSRAMRAADRLPIIMESLTTAYDMVVVECGPADPDGIRRLVAEGTEILVSVIAPDSGVAEVAEMLEERGYAGLTLVTPVGYRSPNDPVPDRSAA